MRAHKFGPLGGRIVPICDICGKYKDSIKPPQTACRTCRRVEEKMNNFARRARGEYIRLHEVFDGYESRPKAELSKTVSKQYKGYIADHEVKPCSKPPIWLLSLTSYINELGVTVSIVFWIALSVIIF